jgi:hypothetical protein
VYFRDSVGLDLCNKSLKDEARIKIHSINLDDDPRPGWEDDIKCDYMNSVRCCGLNSSASGYGKHFVNTVMNIRYP